MDDLSLCLIEFNFRLFDDFLSLFGAFGWVLMVEIVNFFFVLCSCIVFSYVVIVEGLINVFFPFINYCVCSLFVSWETGKKKVKLWILDSYFLTHKAKIPADWLDICQTQSFTESNPFLWGKFLWVHMIDFHKYFVLLVFSLSLIFLATKRENTGPAELT